MENTTIKTTAPATSTTDAKVITDGATPQQKVASAVVNTNKKVGISAPWVLLYKKIRAMFDQDTELEITELQQLIGTANYAFSIGSRNTAKLKAIEKILKSEYVIGNIKLFINFEYQENGDSNVITDIDIQTAFAGNPILSDVKKTDDIVIRDGMVFVLFEPEVVQFFNDDLSDYYGNYNGLAADIAKEIFVEQTNIKYGTDIA